MDDTVAQARAIPALGYREYRHYQLGDRSLLLAELTALDADQVWDYLNASEKSGKVIEAYVQVVCRGACDESGGWAFTVEEARALPARLVVEMAETIMELTGLGIDAGKVAADEAEPPS